MPESDRGAEMRREGNVYGRVGGLEGRTFQEEIENWTGKGLGGRKPEEPKDTRGNQSELGVGGGWKSLPGHTGPHGCREREVLELTEGL